MHNENRFIDTSRSQHMAYMGVNATKMSEAIRLLFAVQIVTFIFLCSGTEKQEDDDDLIFEDFARMRLKGEHVDATEA